MNILRDLAVIGAVCLPSIALAQAGPPDPRPGPSTPVTVTNTPLPVTVGGGVNVSGAVTVNNTDANPVPVVGTVINGETTQQLFDQFITVDKPDYRDNPQVGPIDVRDYKTIRVVLRRGSCGPCGAVAPRAYIRTVGTASTEPRTIDKVTIDNKDGDIGEWASRTYDTVGTSLVISLESDAGSRSTVRVMVFGRAN